MNSINTAHQVRSVALTCDLFQVQPKNGIFTNFQTRNLAWLEQMIGAKSSWSQWGVKTSVITAPTEAKEFKRMLGNNALYLNYMVDADQTWATLYDVENVNVFPAIFDALLQHDLVVGFELPPTLKRALHRAGKHYISFYIHPVRFLRDLCLLVTTNSSDVAALISQREVQSHEVDFQVRKFRALFALQQLPALWLPDDVPVLIGQTEKDSVLIRNGIFTTWEKYDSELSGLLSSHHEIIFLEHPYREKSSPITEYLRGKHGKTVISIRANSYGIIFSPIQIPFFLTLASSLGTEARCAGQDCTFLHNDPCTKFLLRDVDVPRTSMVSHAVLQDEFWKAVFSIGLKRNKSRSYTTSNSFPLGHNFLRNTLNSWAFKELQNGVNIDPVRKLILPATAAKQNRLKVLRTKLSGMSPKTVSHLEIDGCTQLSWGTVVELPKPYTVGTHQTLNFANPWISHNLVLGFHAPEHWGVWSSGKHSKLILPINFPGFMEVNLEIEMTVKVLEVLLAQTPILQIAVNGTKVGIVSFQEPDKNQQKFSFSARIASSVCTLEFHISSTASPGLSSRVPDQRELGFALSALSVGVSRANVISAASTVI